MSGRTASWTIRPMGAADVGPVVRIAAALEHAPHWTEDVYRRILDQGEGPHRVSLVARNPGSEIAGFAVAVLTPPEAELESIAVVLECQRQGVASALWDALKARLIADGVTVVHLEVRAGNLPAQGLYRRLGFAESGHRRWYYADPAEDAVLYRIDLV